MHTRSTAKAALLPFAEDLTVETSAEILDLEGVAERRERFLAHAAAASKVVTYEFAIPAEAKVSGIGPDGEVRDARPQLELIIALTGGALAKFPGGLTARVPVAAAARFEDLAKALIETFLVSWRV
ncbi:MULTISPECIES: hypothetical protein [unclassified Caulobacter]|jgi:hypothetical protein|uniref:hypothetical protein n=1 Tax=unclassified Caulobacter TaxID=2648921 RepID=UPI0007818288|nr:MULTISPECIES: hypothetical protein [unclassified Caulobacter]AZS21715.1 hypothetical protein CSW63_14350 [Caulobacter sp. FWC26]